MPSTTMLSPAAATAMPFCSAFRKRGSSAITWSEGKMPSTASGFSRSIRNAASPQAGAVLRATGSCTICVGGQARQLVGNLLGQKLVGDDPGLFQRGQRLEPLHGLLNHGALAIERQNLLGAGAAGPRPEAGSAATGQDHGTKIDRVRH